MNISQHSVRAQLVLWMTIQKGRPASRLEKLMDLRLAGIDGIDLVEIIWKTEKFYGIIIPDEVPLYTIDDFVSEVYSRLQDRGKKASGLHQNQ